MKDFINPKFIPAICRKELDEFRTLLLAKSDLEERRDILPFFKNRKHLSAFLGSYIPDIVYFDRLSYEYELFGDFSVDLVVGDSQKKCYVFVEFESGTATSIFRKRGNKDTLEWSPAFERGFSQIVDWFWILDDMKPTNHFRSKFGGDYVKIWAMLVAGRTAALQDRDKTRLDWRLDKVVVNSNKLICLTYDDLYQDLEERLTLESQYWAST